MQGTWQFISIRLLEDITKLHDIFDDIESLLWVLLFLAIHHFEYEGSFHMHIFDQTSSRSDESRGRVPTGGCAKKFRLEWPKLTFVRKPLQTFFTSFRRFHQERYCCIARLSYGEDRERPLKKSSRQRSRKMSTTLFHTSMLCSTILTPIGLARESTISLLMCNYHRYLGHRSNYLHQRLAIQSQVI